MPAHRILVTTDFSAQALPGVRQAADLAQRLDSEVFLLYVVEDHLPPILGTTTLGERQEILEHHRQGAAEKLEAYAAEHLPGCRVTSAAVVGVASREIVGQAREQEIDLVVVASHGYGPLRQLLLGSTAERVLHHAPCPVLVVPSKG